MEAQGAGGHVLARAAEHEGVEQLVGDQLARVVEVLGAPGGGDPVAQLDVEAGSAQRDVAEHGHHVDDERLALGAVERLAPCLVDEREQIAGRLDGVRVATGGYGRRRGGAR